MLLISMTRSLIRLDTDYTRDYNNNIDSTDSNIITNLECGCTRNDNVDETDNDQ